MVLYEQYCTGSPYSPEVALSYLEGAFDPEEILHAKVVSNAFFPITFVFLTSPYVCFHFLQFISDSFFYHFFLGFPTCSTENALVSILCELGTRTN